MIAICVDSLKQAIMAYTALYKGTASLMVNLLNQSVPYTSYDEPVL